jgi:hypothetical protein
MSAIVAARFFITSGESVDVNVNMLEESTLNGYKSSAAGHPPVTGAIGRPGD